MEANIIKVGNSKGIIIPAKFLKLVGLKSKANIRVEDDKIIIAPAKKKARAGWEEMIKVELDASGQPTKLFPDFFDSELSDEWTW